MTEDSAFKKQVRARMAETGENYTTARRMVIAERDPGQPPVAHARVHTFRTYDLDVDTSATAPRECAEAILATLEARYGSE